MCIRREEEKGGTAGGNKRYSALLMWPMKTDIPMTYWGDAAFVHLLG